LPIDDSWIATEAPLPKAVAEQQNRIVARLRFIRAEIAAALCLCAKNRK
jgi:hypothetical protein